MADELRVKMVLSEEEFKMVMDGVAVACEEGVLKITSNLAILLGLPLDPYYLKEDGDGGKKNEG